MLLSFCQKKKVTKENWPAGAITCEWVCALARTVAPAITMPGFRTVIEGLSQQF
jgi:hypothetical protein